jgi:hypothetical protein
VRCARDGDQREGETAAGISVVCDAVGDFTTDAGPGAASTTRHDASGPRETSGGGKRHVGSPEDARSKTKVVCRHPAEGAADGVKNGGGNDGWWTSRKTKSRFSSTPTALGNRNCASHIPTAATSHGKVESQNQASHFPTAYGFIYWQFKKGGPEAELRSPLQAHRSIRKCSGCQPARRIPSCPTGAWQQITQRCAVYGRLILNRSPRCEERSLLAPGPF